MDTVQNAVMALVYGRPGTGKTVDIAKAFPTALYVAAPGALTPAGKFIGRIPACVQVTDLDGLILLLKQIANGDAVTLMSGKKEKGFPAIVVDDLSNVVQVSFSEVEKSTKDIRQQYGKIKSKLIEFRIAARKAKIHVIMSAWKKDYVDVEPGKKGEFMPGGPLLVPKESMETLPGMCDIVIRVESNPMLPPKVWPYAYTCDPRNLNWITKDRFDVLTHGPSPMNLREILYLAGGGMKVNGVPVNPAPGLDLSKFPIPRLPDFPNQESLVEQLAGQMLNAPAGGEYQVAAAAFGPLTETSKMPPYVVAWTLSDALHRAQLTRAFITKQSENPYA